VVQVITGLTRIGIAAFVLTIGAWIAAMVTLAQPHGATPSTQPDTYVLPACQVEDQDNCIGDAQSFGNGSGTDWVNIDGVLYRAVR